MDMSAVDLLLKQEMDKNDFEKIFYELYTAYFKDEGLKTHRDAFMSSIRPRYGNRLGLPETKTWYQTSLFWFDIEPAYNRMVRSHVFPVDPSLFGGHKSISYAYQISPVANGNHLNLWIIRCFNMMTYLYKYADICHAALLSIRENSAPAESFLSIVTNANEVEMAVSVKIKKTVHNLKVRQMGAKIVIMDDDYELDSRTVVDYLTCKDVHEG